MPSWNGRIGSRLQFLPPAVPPAPVNADRILAAIRSEARARGAKGRIGAYSSDGAAVALGAGGVGRPGLPLQPPTHVADFLAMPLDVFIGVAYDHLLGRDPDPEGGGHYQRMLLRGRLTRIEVLGRLAFSAEGRKHAKPVPGLALAFLAATFYRVPVAGPVAGWIAMLLRVPAHWRDRTTIEAIALADGSWMKR